MHIWLHDGTYHHILSIYIVWLTENINSFYLIYNVPDDQFCCELVTGLDAATYQFSFSCCYFGLYEILNAKLNKYLKCFVAAGYAVSSTVIIIIMILLGTNFCHYEFICENLYPSSIFSWLLVLSHYRMIFFVLLYSSIHGIIHQKIPCLICTHINIYLFYNIITLFTKRVALLEQVVVALNTEVDDQNIRGGYNTTGMMDYFHKPCT